MKTPPKKVVIRPKSIPSQRVDHSSQNWPFISIACFILFCFIGLILNEDRYEEAIQEKIETEKFIIKNDTIILK